MERFKYVLGIPSLLFGGIVNMDVKDHNTSTYGCSVINDAGPLDYGEVTNRRSYGMGRVAMTIFLAAYMAVVSGCTSTRSAAGQQAMLFYSEQAMASPGGRYKGEKKGFSGRIKDSGCNYANALMAWFGWGRHEKTKDGRVVPCAGASIPKGIWHILRQSVGIPYYVARGLGNKAEASKIWARTYLRMLGGPAYSVKGVGYDLPCEAVDTRGDVNFVKTTLYDGVLSKDSGTLCFSHDLATVWEGFTDGVEGFALGTAHAGLSIPEALVGRFRSGADLVGRVGNATNAGVTTGADVLGGNARERAGAVGWKKFARADRRTLTGIPLAEHASEGLGHTTTGPARHPRAVPLGGAAVDKNVKPKNYFRAVIEDLLAAIWKVFGGNVTYKVAEDLLGEDAAAVVTGNREEGEKGGVTITGGPGE